MRASGWRSRILVSAGVGAAAVGVVAAAWVPVALALQPAGDPAGHFAAGALWARWVYLLTNTAGVVTVALITSLPVAWVLAAQAFKWRWWGADGLSALIAMAAALPTYVTFAALVAVTGTSWARESVLATGVVAGALHLPLAALLLGLGQRGVERELEEAALLAVPPARVLWSVTVRRAAWSIGSTAGIVAWLVATDYSVTDILQVRTFAEEIYTEYGAWGPAARPLRIAAPLMVFFGLGGAAAAAWALRRARPLLQGAARPAPLRFTPTGRHWRCVWIVGVLLVLGWPLADVFARIGSPARLGELFVTFAPEWGRTLTVAVCTASLAAAAGTALAWCIVWRRWMRWVIVGCLTVLIAVPAPALAIALVWTLSAALPESLEAVPGATALWVGAGQLRDHRIAMHVLAIGLRFLPVAVALILPGMAAVPHELDDAARLDGAGPWRRLVDLHAPLVRGRVALAAVVVGILAVGELDCAHMVAPPDGELLSIRLATFIHNGVDADVAAVCLAATISTVVPAALAWWVWGRERTYS